MNTIIELIIKDASIRAVDNLKDGVRELLGGNGFKVSSTQNCVLDEGRSIALGETGSGCARIRVYTAKEST
jgi:hypothetical protein